jgi:hypothetical protein
MIKVNARKTKGYEAVISISYIFTRLLKWIAYTIDPICDDEEANLKLTQGWLKDIKQVHIFLMVRITSVPRGIPELSARSLMV